MLSPHNKPAFLTLIPPSFTSPNPLVTFFRPLQPHSSSHNWGKYENSRFNSDAFSYSSRSEVYNLVARETRVYHSSIARSAWFPLGYKSIEFGWCPPWRHPVVTSKCTMGFQATDFHRRQRSGFSSWRRVFSSVNYNNVYGRRWVTTQHLR